MQVRLYVEQVGDCCVSGNHIDHVGDCYVSDNQLGHRSLCGGQGRVCILIMWVTVM